MKKNSVAKRVSILFLAVVLAVSTIPSVAFAQESQQYSDVKSTDWFYSQVEKAAQSGLMTGIAATDTFEPESPMTRAQAVAVVYRAAMKYVPDTSPTQSKSNQTPFADVAKSSFYTQALNWAYEAKVVKGYENTDLFMPDNSVTREEYLVMLARILTLKPGTYVTGTSPLNDYRDSSDISRWAEVPFYNACRNSIIEGVVVERVENSDGTVTVVRELQPQRSITRAEACKMTNTYVDRYVEGDR